MCNSGIYIIRFDDLCIKIGRSKDITKRLKQYIGYRSQATEPQKILLVYTQNYKQIEQHSHRFAENYGLPRYKPYEVFECPLDQTESFIQKYRDFLFNFYKEHIHSIKDKFDIVQTPQPYIAPPISNLNIQQNSGSSSSESSEPVDCIDTPQQTFEQQFSQYRYVPKNKQQI